MDEPTVDATGLDPVLEIATSLRALADRPLTQEQMADLDAVLGELELLVRKGTGDASTLARCNGDLKVIETAAGWAGVSQAPVSQATVSRAPVSRAPVSRAQRERIKRLLPWLGPEPRRPRRWRRPL
jgi:hypothetical protein